MAEPIRVLVLEDSPEDAELMILGLQDVGFEPVWSRVERAAEFLAALTPPTDVILADFSLPQFSGLLALNLLKGRGIDIPFIVVTGHDLHDLVAHLVGPEHRRIPTACFLNKSAQCLAHQPGLFANVNIADVAFQLVLGRQCGNRVHHNQLDALLDHLA